METTTIRRRTVRAFAAGLLALSVAGPLAGTAAAQDAVPGGDSPTSIVVVTPEVSTDVDTSGLSPAEAAAVRGEVDVDAIVDEAVAEARDGSNWGVNLQRVAVLVVFALASAFVGLRRRLLGR